MAQLSPNRPRDRASISRTGAVRATSARADEVEAAPTEATGTEEAARTELTPTGALPQFDPTLELTGPLPIVAKRRLGESDLVVYPLCLGGNVFGWTADGESSHQIMDRYRVLGGNFIDTADVYAGGRSEVLVGSWMRDRGNRDQMVLATKVGRHKDNPGLSSISIVRAVEASLERLQSDYIDLLYFHDDDLSVPMEDSLATAEWLIESGKVRYIAASNFSADRLIEARILSSTGLPQFVAIQTHYNLLHRSEFEADLRIVAAAQGLAVMPYYALANGFLTGKYRTKEDLADTARGARAAEYLNRRGHRALAALDRVARAHGSSPASIALAWLQAKRNVTAPVASASRPEQVDALMVAASIRLTRAQMLELDRVSE
ncbi:MAG: hypothetical protein QOH55_869 [Microbacteriaceae bacterium]|jgi:aryl-alcohol dehydrogenase-like predicted oxidoreductase|nr:hypothetical protein [Microbacteriaceae bacterium]